MSLKNCFLLSCLIWLNASALLKHNKNRKNSHQAVIKKKWLNLPTYSLLGCGAIAGCVYTAHSINQYDQNKTQKNPNSPKDEKKEADKEADYNTELIYEEHSNQSYDRAISAVVMTQILDSLGEGVSKKIGGRKVYYFSDDTARALEIIEAGLQTIHQFGDNFSLTNQEQFDFLRDASYENNRKRNQEDNSFFNCAGRRVGCGSHMANLWNGTYKQKNCSDLQGNDKAKQSAGNGAIMGLAGALFLFPAKLDQLELACAAFATATHPNEIAVDVAKYMAHLLFHAANSKALRLVDRFKETLENSKKYRPLNQYCNPLVNCTWKKKAFANKSNQLIDENLINADAGTVIQTLEAALKIINDSINICQNEDSAIVEFICENLLNFKGAIDKDTVGAVLGAILGALCGTSLIPKKYIPMILDNNRVYQFLLLNLPK